MIRRPPRSTQSRSSAASDVYKRQPQRESALNILKGKILNMSDEASTDNILTEVVVAQTHLNARITKHSAIQLQLVPGREVWIVFKATSLQWI